MDETGQPGAATPGEHGDGTGQRDDLAHSASAWAPSGAGWSRAADGGSRGEPARSQWRPADSGRGWASSSPEHGDLPAPMPGIDEVSELPSRVNGRRLNGHAHRDESPSARQVPVSAPPGLAGEPDHGRLAVPAQRPAPALEQAGEPGREAALRHPTGGQPVLPSDGPAVRHPTGGYPVVGSGGTSIRPAVDADPLRHPTGGYPALSAEGRAARHASDEPPAPTVERRVGPEPSEGPEPAGQRRPEGSRPESVPPTPPPAGFDTLPSRSTPSVAAQPADGPGAGGTPTGSPARGEPADRYPTDAYPADRHPTDAYPADPYPIDPGPAVSGVDAERRPWNPPTEPERPSWAGGGWAPPWSREQGGGRRSRAERHREDDEPTGRRPREERPREDVPPAWTPPPAAREPEPRRLADPARLPSTDPAVARTPAPEPDAGRAPRPEPGSGRTPPAEPAAARTPTTEPTPYRAAETGDPRVPSAEPGAPYRVAGRRSPEPESEPRRPYPPMDQTSWASARPSAVPSSAPPVPSPVDPTDPSGARPETRTLRPFRLRPEAAEADHPPSVGRHPDRPGAGPLAAPATGGTGRSDSFPPAPAPASAPPYTARRSAPDPVSPAPSTVADRHPAGTPAVLPQRVPAEPDVPVVPEPPAVEPPAQTPEPARIATHLRREDEPAPPQERPEGFDVNAILDAVRGVAGVHDASLRRTAAGAHSLRLDLADGADAAEVSRMVARLLQERMGLAAAPHLPGPAPVPDPPVRRRMAPPPENRAELPADVRRRRQQPGTPRGRASVEEQPTPWAAFGGAATGSPVAATGSPATLAASYSGGQRTTTETAPSRPLDTGGAPGPRVVIDHVQVSTFGLDADVEVRLLAGERNAAGRAVGPAVDGYVLRLCAVAAAAAVDELLRIAGSGRGRCFVEHAAVVPFGTCEVATVVVLLVCDGWVEQLAGSALVSGADPRQAVVRATLAAVNRRLEALLT